MVSTVPFATPNRHNHVRNVVGGGKVLESSPDVKCAKIFQHDIISACPVCMPGPIPIGFEYEGVWYALVYSTFL